MFEIGEYVVCGNKGVCSVEDITTLNISGVDKERKYYILKPVYLSQSTVYVPVDSSKESMRRVLQREEAERLIDGIPQIPLLILPNDRLIEQTYKECLRANRCEELVKLIKTIYSRERKRMQAGRKITSVDERYFHLAQETLYGELAVALGRERSEMQNYMEEKLQRMEELQAQ